MFDAIYSNSEYSPPGKMDKDNKHNYWVIFCKSLLSIANYVEKYKSIDDYNRYTQQFMGENPDIRLALPLIIKEEIFGFKFALACDFVKENISPLVY